MFQGSTLSGGSNTFEGDMETMAGIDWNGIINQAFGIGSHAISAFSGKNSGTQIGYNPQSGSVFAIQQSQPIRNFDDTGYYTEQQQYAIANAQRNAAAAGVGGTVGSGVDGVFNWLMANPLITFGGIAALYLLMKEPPRRR